MKVELLDPASIKVSTNRQRKRWGDLQALAASIQRHGHGLIHPIAVNRIDGKDWLVAGGRRLEAYIRYIPNTPIPAHIYEDLSLGDCKIAEFQENFDRADLTWQESCLAVLDIHTLGEEIYKDDWSIEEIAKRLGLGDRTASRKIRIARALRESNERVTCAPTEAAAHNILERATARALDTELSALASLDFTESQIGSEPEVASGPGLSGDLNFDETILDGLDLADGQVEYARVLSSSENCPGTREWYLERANRPASLDLYGTDFIEFARDYTDRAFNLICIDPPYGLGHQNSAQGASSSHGAYNDSEDTFWEFLDALLDNRNRLLARSSHLLVWYSMKYYSAIRSQFHLAFKDSAIPYQRFDFPFIWHKSDNTGIIPDAQRGPRQIYETCMLFSIGDRKIVKPISNLISHPAAKAHAKHLSEKPLAVMSYLLSMYVDEHTDFADFCCGAGSSVVAAENLGARSVFGLEKDPTHLQTAQEALTSTRSHNAAGDFILG